MTRPILHRVGWTKPEDYSADLEAWLNRGKRFDLRWLAHNRFALGIAGLSLGYFAGQVFRGWVS